MYTTRNTFIALQSSVSIGSDHDPVETRNRVWKGLSQEWRRDSFGRFDLIYQRKRTMIGQFSPDRSLSCLRQLVACGNY